MKQEKLSLEEVKLLIKKQIEDLRNANTSLHYFNEIQNHSFEDIQATELQCFINHSMRCMQNNVILTLYRLFEKRTMWQKDNDNFSLHEILEFLQNNKSDLDSKAEENITVYNKKYNNKVIVCNTGDIVSALEQLIEDTKPMIENIKLTRNANAHPKEKFMLGNNLFAEEIGLTEKEIKAVIYSCDKFYNRLCVFLGIMPEAIEYLQGNDLKQFFEKSKSMLDKEYNK